MKRIAITVFALLLCLYFIQCTKTKAEAKFSTTTIDFGNRLKTDTLVGEFFVENLGDEELLLQTVQPDCGCTVAKYSKAPIQKNQKRKIEFTYIPKKNDTGAIAKQIIVKTNSLKRLQVIVFKALLPNS